MEIDHHGNLDPVKFEEYRLCIFHPFATVSFFLSFFFPPLSLDESISGMVARSLGQRETVTRVLKSSIAERGTYSIPLVCPRQNA